MGLEQQREQQAQALQIVAKSDEEQLKLHRMLLFQRELQLLNQQQNLRNNRPCVTGDRVVIVGSSATGGRYDGREGLVVSDGSSAKSAGGPSFPPDPMTCWVKILNVDGSDQEEAVVELPASSLMRLRRKFSSNVSNAVATSNTANPPSVSAEGRNGDGNDDSNKKRQRGEDSNADDHINAAAALRNLRRKPNDDDDDDDDDTDHAANVQRDSSGVRVSDDDESCRDDED